MAGTSSPKSASSVFSIPATISPGSARPSTDNSATYTISGSTPHPYLPLRKASSEALRNAHANGARRTSARRNEYIPGAKIGTKGCVAEDMENAGVMLPRTTYKPASPQSQPKQYKGLQPRVKTVARARSFSEDPSLSIQPARQTILRSATSIPDYKAIRNAQQKTAASLPPSPQLPQLERTVSAGHSLHSTRNPTFWRDGGANSLRTSIRSALSDTSSVTQQEWSETERSSVWTNASTASEFIPHNPHWPLIKEEEMSVEDAVDMYADGFSEEGLEKTVGSKDGSPVLPRTSSSPSVSADSPVVKADSTFSPTPPPQIIAGSFTNLHKGSISLPQPQIRASSHVASGHIDHTPPVENRLKALISVPRDQYGFKKQSKDVTVAQYDAWNAGYVKYLERRKKKWIALMKHHNLPIDNPVRFPPRSDKVKRYIRKGIPPEWRGAAWFWYAGGPAMLNKQAGVYDILLKRASTGHLSEQDREHIERDLHRTYPDNIHFKPDVVPPTNIPSRPSASADDANPTTIPRPASSFNTSNPDTPLINSLRNVLQAFAIHNPRTGYCQSLNFLAAHLLLFLSGDEERAFHLLCILTTVHLPGTHGIALEGANIDIGVLMLLLRDLMPALWPRIDDRADATLSLAAGDMRVSTGLPTVSLATTAWFMSCFASTFPPETTCRVWDALFYEGSKTLFRVGLAIFKIGEPEMRRATEPMEAFQVVQTLPRRLLDANMVMDVATGKRRAGLFGGVGVGGAGKEGFGAISQKMVERRREERRGLYRKERERVLKSVEGETAAGGEAGASAGEGQKTLSKKPSRMKLNRLKSLRSPGK